MGEPLELLMRLKGFVVSSLSKVVMFIDDAAATNHNERLIVINISIFSSN